MTFQPIRPNWLSPGFDAILADEPELLLAYELTDYPSRMTGEGDWADLYIGTAGEFPIGRLWVAPETDAIGLEELPGGNTDHLTRIALQLRSFNAERVPVLNAFGYILQHDGYVTVNVGFGDLADAALPDVDPT